MKPIRSTAVLTLLLPLAACSLFIQACTDSHAHSGTADPFDGAWKTVVTLRDCSAGAPLVHTTASPRAARGSGGGNWSRGHDGSYTAQFRFRRYNGDGSMAGTNVVTSTRRLAADLNSYSGFTRGEVRDSGGAVIAVTCVADTGTRLR